ncbi:MAG: MFS transporter [Mycobacteriaceae bacterium]
MPVGRPKRGRLGLRKPAPEPTRTPDSARTNVLPPLRPPQADPSAPTERNARFADSTQRDRPHNDAERLPRTRDPGPARAPRKLTVTRVAALRSRQLTRDGLQHFHRAASADGADKSGLTSLTYAVMANYASDAAIAVSLANTLFFAAATGESKSKVALYLLITVAPFAVIAPLIGPLLDRIQRGRRLALAGSFVGRALLAVVMALNFDTWELYPAALGILVLTKSFGVLKSSVMPRVLPPNVSLVKSNSRITVFGLVGTTVVGALASGIAFVTGSGGALFFSAAVMVAGAWLCMRIPAWVEVTEGEVPTTLVFTHADERAAARPRKGRAKKQPLGRSVLASLWGTGTTRVLTGFITLFIAFVAKVHADNGLLYAATLGVVGAAAGLGNFAGNVVGARMHLGKPEMVIIWCAVAALALTIVAAVIPGLATAALVTLVGAIASALSKVSLDATMQRDLPEAARASAFGRSETVLQLAWVLGGAFGVLLPPTYWVGFTVIAVILALGTAQTLLTNRGSTLLPGLGGAWRPQRGSAAANYLR